MNACGSTRQLIRIILSSDVTPDDALRRVLLAIGVDLPVLASYLRSGSDVDEIRLLMTDMEFGDDDACRLRALHALGIFLSDLLVYLPADSPLIGTQVPPECTSEVKRVMRER